MPTERFVVDDRARRLPLGAGAGRIVSLAPSGTECLLCLGAGERLVGVEEHSALPPGLGSLPRIGYEVPAGMIKRPGPGLLDGLERLAVIFAAEGR